MKNHRSFFGGIIFLIFSSQVWAQESQKSIQTILDDLQVRHGVYFSYADKNLSKLSLAIDLESFEHLAEVLNWITEETGLIFVQLEETQFIVRRLSETRVHQLILLDKVSRQPVIGALVYGADYDVSDSEGKILISTSEGSELIVQHLGYQTIRYQISKKTQDTLLLTQNVRVLPDLQVFNYLSDGMYKAVDGSIVLAVDPLRMLPGMTEPDILQSLKFLPGIQSTNESLSEINIRGGTPDQNLLLYNDVRVYQPGHFFGLISVFNPQMIQEARLIKEGTSVAYGDAASGVIALKSNDEIPSEIKATVGVSLLNLDGQVTLPIGERGAVTLSGRRSLGDLMTTPTYQSYFDRAFSDTEIDFQGRSSSVQETNEDQTFLFYDAQIQYVQKLKDDRSSFKAFGLSIANELTFNETAVLNGTTRSRESNLKQESLMGGADLIKWWNDSFNTRFLGSFSRYDLVGNNSDVLREQLLQQTNQVLDYQFKIENRWQRSSRTDFLFGYQGNNIGVLNVNELNNPSIREEIKRVLTNHTLFGEVYTSIAGMDVQAGLRNVLFLEPRKVSIEPRIRLFRPLTNHLGIEATAEVKSQSLFHRVDLQTDFLGVEKRKWFLEEREFFTPIVARQATLGMQYQKEGFLIDGKLYIKDVQEISTISQDFVNQFSRVVENGSYRVNGLDLLVNYRWKGWNSWSSYSYMDNQFDFPNLVPPSFLNNTSVPHNLSTGVSYRNLKWDVSTGVNWHLGRPYTTVTADSVVNNAISFDVPNGNRLPNFFRWDLSGQYRWNLSEKWKGIIGLSIWNVTNRQNIISRYFRLQEDFSLNRVDQPSLPFTLNAVLRLRFN